MLLGLQKLRGEGVGAGAVVVRWFGRVGIIMGPAPLKMVFAQGKVLGTYEPASRVISH